jgi:protein-disulfide isomerase/uncharacterized membrane protein
MSNNIKYLPKLVLVLSFIGLVLSLTSLYQHTKLQYGFATEPSFCNINATFNCDAVNKSEWSTHFGIPIASYGVAFYFVLVLFSLLAFAESLISNTKYRSIVLALSIFASLYSIYLFIVSEFFIGSMCLICIGLYLVNFAILISSILLSTSRGFVESISDGFLSLISWPIYIISISKNPAASALARIGFLVAVSVFSLSITLPDYFITRVFVQIKSDKERLKEVVSNFYKLPTVSLPITFEGAQRDYQIGPDSAPIKLVEFSDFECPACKRFYHLSEKLLEEYKDQIQITFKNYPLSSTCNLLMPRNMHPNACFAAYFARCAGEQGKFWEASKFLFTLESFGSGDEKNINQDILNGSQALALDKAAIEECVASERTKNKIASDVNEGNKLGVGGTPTIYLNGRLLSTGKVDEINAIFESILSNNKS